MSQVRRKVLVFGATGEIGSRIAHGCVQVGHTVTGVTRGSNTRPRADLAGVEMLVANKCEADCYENVLAGREFDVVIDSVPRTEDVKLVHEYFAGRIEHYIMCSSTGTYVPLRHCPADETHPWREKTEVNFYPQCQRDAYALDLCKQDGFPVTILRPTNIIGPGRVPLELWGGRNPLYFKLMRAGETVEIPQCGNILLQSGYDDDLATAFVSAVTKGSEICGEIINISTRRAITLNRYFEVAADVLASRSAVEYLSIDEIVRRRPDDATRGGLRFLVEHMCFDMSKAERLLGYQPQYTGEEGLQRALAWCIDEKLV